MLLLCRYIPDIHIYISLSSGWCGHGVLSIMLMFKVNTHTQVIVEHVGITKLEHAVWPPTLRARTASPGDNCYGECGFLFFAFIWLPCHWQPHASLFLSFTSFLPSRLVISCPPFLGARTSCPTGAPEFVSTRFAWLTGCPR